MKNILLINWKPVLTSLENLLITDKRLIENVEGKLIINQKFRVISNEFFFPRKTIH